MNVIYGRHEPDNPVVVECHDDVVPRVGKKCGRKLRLNVMIEYVRCDIRQDGSVSSAQKSNFNRHGMCSRVFRSGQQLSGKALRANNR